MKSKVDKIVNMHVELSEVELIDAITEYVKQHTRRLSGPRKGGLLRMDKIRISARTFGVDVIDITGQNGVSGDIEHVDFHCEVR